MSRSRSRGPRSIALLAAVALVTVACAGGGGGGEASTLMPKGGTVTHGTTEQPGSFDPAGPDDRASWNVVYNVYNGLLKIRQGEVAPEPDLADSCRFVNPTTYTCDLKKGVQFHDGSDFTSNDVEFSFRRVIQIDHPNGPCRLLASLARCGEWNGTEIEILDPQTVTFHLRRPDARWPFVLATAAGAIVPSIKYPSRNLQPDTSVIGTGAYRLAQHVPGRRTVLRKNLTFFGDPALNDRVVIRYYESSSALRQALEGGEVDVAYRDLSAADIEGLRSATDVNLVEGRGAEITYLVFNLRSGPLRNLNLRRAIAYSIDREAIARDVYDDTVEPLFSVVPSGLTGHVQAFADEYGRFPDVLGAEEALGRRGAATNLRLTIWTSPSRFGPGTRDEYEEIKRALESTGFFDVEVKSAGWRRYRTAALRGDYPAFQFGWRGDYPDPDSYLAPFYAPDPSSFDNGYRNRSVNRLIEDERAETDPGRRAELLQRIQRIIARDAPVVPIWQAKQMAAVREGIAGVGETLDASLQFRYWLITRE